MLSVRSVCVEYPALQGPAFTAAYDVSFEVPKGAFFTLLGPSGCGKTTILRSLAGLERPASGEIQVDGQVVYSSAQGIFVPPNQRKFGMVFQSYAIWPHLNVFSNVSLPLEVSKPKPGKEEIRRRVRRVLDAVGLGHLETREATKLSGGQQQRLALARALVMEPRLLLLDEPLSNLDAKLRERMRGELKRIQRELGITTIYVTHDQSEALTLSHEVAVMNEGRVVQIGAPREIYERPHNMFVADFIGSSNFLDATVLGQESAANWRVRTAIGDVLVQSVSHLAPDLNVTISVRPEDVELMPASAPSRPDRNDYGGVVEKMAFLGDVVIYEINVAGCILQSRAHPSVGSSVGDPVRVSMSTQKCIALPKGAVTHTP